MKFPTFFVPMHISVTNHACIGKGRHRHLYMQDISEKAPTYHIVGSKPNPAFAECIPEFRQIQEASCAIKCQQLILRDFGIEISEEELCRIAEQNGWYDPSEGTYMRNNGLLLSLFNINYTHSQHNTIADIAREIGFGHRVMVKVNAHKLYSDKEVNFRHLEANHAVLVYGVVYATEGCQTQELVITNPATGYVFESRPLDRFIDSWKDSHHYMLTTNQSAPFIYDYSEKIYIPIRDVCDNQP